MGWESVHDAVVRTSRFFPEPNWKWPVSNSLRIVMSIITVERKILEKNDTRAAMNRTLFARNGVTVLNLVSSPGAGKTTLLEHTIARLRGIIPMAVIEGDVQTDLDARRIGRWDIPVVQIVTNGGCHLDAGLLFEAIEKMQLNGVQILFVENVGNLVCPANYDLGEQMKVVIASVTEGEDKPLKYPAMFRNASVLIINKIDLLPYINASVTELRANALKVNPQLRVFEVSCTEGTGIQEWCTWLRGITGSPR
jgi:hydrogenase nickel incorporation protein HypB